MIIPRQVLIAIDQLGTALFFWQEDRCRKSYESEQARSHLPPNLRSDP